jgi:hypothetical protein
VLAACRRAASLLHGRSYRLLNRALLNHSMVLRSKEDLAATNCCHPMHTRVRDVPAAKPALRTII